MANKIYCHPNCRVGIKDHRSRRTWPRIEIMAAIAWLLPFCNKPGAAQPEPSRGAGRTPPLVVVCPKDELPVETVAVSITNPLQDAAMLVTSVEFEGQLPELRYFHHGIYGAIERNGDVYEHHGMLQQLSRPVATCFLLPGQSASWRRPMRVLKGGYRAKVVWHEIPEEQIGTSVWFASRPGKMGSIFESLAKNKEFLYRGLCAAGDNMIRVVTEGDFPSYSSGVDAPCVLRDREIVLNEDRPAYLPPNSIEYRLEPIAPFVVVTADQVVFGHRDHTPNPAVSPDLLTPIEADFLFLCSRDKKPVPCLLAPNDFGDLIEVNLPVHRMYYDPGITNVPLSLFPEILNRARERNLRIRLERIDPNSLGQLHVLTVRKPRGELTGREELPQSRPALP